MRYALLILFLASIASGCSQTTLDVQTPPTQSIHTAHDTIDFDSDPLWREADTTLIIKLGSAETITSFVISDSNFLFLDSMQTKDSLRISLRFQPHGTGNHKAQCLVLSKKDTLEYFTLLGVATPFERRIGDSYVFADTSGRLDSIWVSALPLTFSTRDSDDIDSMYRSAMLNPSGDWIVQPPMAPYLTHPASGTLPVSTLTASDKNWTAIDSNFQFPAIENYSFQSSADSVANTEFVSKHTFVVNRITMDDSDYIKFRWTEMFFHGTFEGNYSADLGFFVSSKFSSSYYGLYIGSQISKQSQNSYHLLRFHLRR